jgi:hypothetical protein
LFLLLLSSIEGRIYLAGRNEEVSNCGGEINCTMSDCIISKIKIREVIIDGYMYS